MKNMKFDRKNNHESKLIDDITHIIHLFTVTYDYKQGDFLGEITNYIPPINLSVFQRRFISADELQVFLSLDIERRFSLAKFINENFNLLKSSVKAEALYGIILQTFSSLYFMDNIGQYLSQIPIFLETLVLANDVYPNGIDTIFRTFYHFYNKITSVHYISQLIGSLENFFSMVPITPNYFIPSHIEASFTIVSHISCDFSSVPTNEMISFLIRVSSFLQTTKDIVVEKKMAQLFFYGIDQCSNRDYFDNSSLIIIALLSLSLEVSRLSNILYSGFVNILIRCLRNLHVFDSEISSDDSQFDSVYLLRFLSASQILGLFDQYFLSIIAFCSGLPSDSAFCFINHILSFGQSYIVNGNLNLLFVFLYLVSLNNFSGEKIRKLIIEVDIIPVFFNSSLFSERTLFRNKNYPIISLRQLAIKVFQKFVVVLSENHIRSHIVPFMMSIAPFPDQFTELLFHIHCLFKLEDYTHKAIIDIIFCMSIFMGGLLKEPLASYNCFVLSSFFAILRLLLKSFSFSKELIETGSLSSLLLSVLEKNETINGSCDIIQSLIVFSVDNFGLIDYKSFYSNFSQIIDRSFNNDLFLVIADRFMKIIHTSIVGASEDFLIHFSQTSIFNSLIKIINIFSKFPDIDINHIYHKVFTSVLIVLNTFSGLMMRGIVIIDWEPFPSIIQKIGLSQTVYSVLLSILSCDQIVFSGIKNHSAVSLIDSILESEFSSDFLTKILKVIESSEIECVNCATIGFHRKIIGILQRDCKGIEIELAISVLSEILNHICDRESYGSLLGLLDNSLSSIDFFEHIIKMIKNFAMKYKHSMKNIMRFTNHSGNVTLQPISVNDFTGSFSAAFQLLFTGFQTSDDIITLMSLSSEKHWFSCSLSKNQIKFMSSVFPIEADVSISLSIPENSWFSLLISVDNLSSFSVFINGKICGNVKTSVYIWEDAIDAFILFQPLRFLRRSITSSIQGFSGIFCFFKCSITEKMANMFTSYTQENYYDISKIPRIHVLISPKYHNDSVLNNLIDDAPHQYSFTTEIINDKLNFCDMLESLKGIHRLIHLLSQIQSNENISAVFIDVLDTICAFISVSDEIQNQMALINGFGLISLFMYTHYGFINLDCAWKAFIHLWPSIRNEDLLSQFFYHILFDFHLWNTYDGFPIINLIKKWNEVSSSDFSIFQKYVSFDNMICIAHDLLKSPSFDNDLMTSISSILIFISKSCISDSSLNKLLMLMDNSKENPAFLYQMLHIFYILSLDIPSESEKIQTLIVANKDKIILNNSSIFVLIVQLFAFKNRNCYIDCVLYYLGECYDREENDNANYALLFCNSYVNQKYESFNELLSAGYFPSIQFNMLPFVIISAFYCEKSVFDFISSFLGTLFNTPQTLSQIAFNIDSFSLFFLVSFALILCPDFVYSLVNLLSVNIKLLEDTFSLIDMVSKYTRRDYHNFQSSLASALVLVIFERHIIEEIVLFVRVVVRFLFFGYNRSVISRENQNLNHVHFDFFKLVETIRANPIDSQEHSYGLYFDDGKWDDINLAILLVHCLKEPGIPIPTIRQLVYVMSFVLREDPEYVPEIIPYINFLAENLFISSGDLSPMFFQIAKNIEQYKTSSVLLTKYSINLIYCIDTYQSYINSFSVFYESFEGVSSAEDNLRKTLESNIETIPGISFSFTSQKEEMVHETIFRFKNLKRTWKSICQQFLFEYLPFKHLNYTQGPCLRLSRFDSHYRQILFSTIKKPEIIYPELPQEFLGKENYLKIKQNSHIWSSQCERIKIATKQPGIFYLFDNRIVFEFKNSIINIFLSSIECIFWRWTYHVLDSVIIYTNTYRGYIFRFPGLGIASFILSIKKMNLPNCIFLQESISSVEIERLQLTSRWKSKQISNFDYLNWLNLFSGRSFIDEELYPIYPLLDISQQPGNSYVNQRDLSKNVALLNNEAIMNLKNEKSKECFDGNDVPLFDTSMMSKRFVKYLLGNIFPYSKISCSSGKDQFSSISNYLLTRRSIIETYEMIPDAFCSPEFLNQGIANDIGLEKGRLAPAIVYNHRAILESPNVSVSIHKWIDLIWGFKQRGMMSYRFMNSYDYRLYPDVWDNVFFENEKESIIKLLEEKGSIPQQLFIGPHPPRNEGPNYPRTSNISVQGGQYPVLAIKCLGSDRCRIYSLNINGMIFLSRPGINAVELETLCIPKSLLPKNPCFIGFLKGEGYSFFYFRFCDSFPSFYDNQKQSVILVNHGPNNGKLISMCLHGSSCITGSTLGCITQWRVINDKLNASYYSIIDTNPIISVCSSSCFGIVVSINSQLMLRTHIVPEFRITNEIKIPSRLKYRGIHTVISDEYGVISVALNHDNGSTIMNFTINGVYFIQKEFPHSVNTMISFVSSAFRDYLAIIFNGSIFVILDAVSFREVRKCEFSETLGRLSYNKDNDSVIASSSNGNFFIIKV